MQPLLVILICCIALSMVTSGQRMACTKSTDQNCNNLFGCIGCIICCGSIIYILSGQAT